MINLQALRPILNVAVAIALLWAGFAPPTEAGTGNDPPSPLSGPGVDVIKKSKRNKIQKAWKDLSAGNLQKSRERVARLGELAPARLLEFQIQFTEGGEDLTDELVTFCEANPDYAAAWITLSIAAERAGLESVALHAARRAGALWPTPPWSDRPGELEQRWITDRIIEANRLFDAGEPERALTELEAAGALDPLRRDGVILGARIAFANGEIEEAEELLDTLPGDSDAIYLKGNVAESRQDWQTAMDSYSQLPESHPDRVSALQRAQIRWRLTLLPTYTREAMSADQVTRGDLAVILASIQPRLETLPGGAVPVMSDIVDHPGQREIITIVRLGIMTADTRGHLFYPESEATAEGIREAIRRSRLLLGLSAPIWCTEPNVVGSACRSIPSPTSGGMIVNAVLDVMSGAGP